MATQVSDRPATQDRVIVLKSAEETAGELFRCEYIARVVSPRAAGSHTHASGGAAGSCRGYRAMQSGGTRVRPRAGECDGHPARHAARRVERRPSRLALDFRIPPRDECPGNVPRIHRQSVIAPVTELRMRPAHAGTGDDCVFNPGRRSERENRHFRPASGYAADIAHARNTTSSRNRRQHDGKHHGIRKDGLGDLNAIGKDADGSEHREHATLQQHR